ncbi:MAG TPA: SseB family protein [Trebonia sp.]|nr:SseB family protein [Trebonia sp.]
MLTAVAASRLLVPIVAVPVATDSARADKPGLEKPGLEQPGADESGAGNPGPERPPGKADPAKPGAGEPGPAKRGADEPGAGNPGPAKPGAGEPGPAKPGAGQPGPARLRAGAHGADKETDMALPTLIGNDGRKAVIAFTGIDTIRRWRADARPVPVPAARLWPAVAAEQADAVVIDVAGPVPFVIEGARLAALARGEPPPPAYQDPDIRAQVAAVTPDFVLEPGPPEADLTVVLKTDPASARAAAETIAARLAPRLRRGIAVRIA